MSNWKRLTPIGSCEASDGSLYPSYLGSWLTWRKQLSNGGQWSKFSQFSGNIKYWEWTREDVIKWLYILFKTEDPDGTCPQCHDKSVFKIVNGSESWTIRCICDLTAWMHRKANLNSSVCSHLERATFADYDMTGGSGKVNPTLEIALQASKEFATEPSRWLILSGPKGLGKTHLARAIASNLGPGIALYVRAQDFLQQLMGETAKKENGDVNGFMNAVRRAPILILDDLGTEHAKAYARSMLHDIIDFRYQNMREYPLMITTNETEAGFLSDTWGITGDRIVDQRTQFITMAGPSYRQSSALREEGASWQ